MAKNRAEQGIEEVVGNVREAEAKTGSFVERNQYSVIGIAALLILAAGAYMAYNLLYQAPREKAAMEQMFKAEYQFQRDSFALALESPGDGYDGFLDIVDNYGGTKSANLAKYYAGISYLNLNRFEDAISYLKSYSAAGGVTPITKWGAIGDAQSELGDMAAAISSYQKAVGADANAELTPYYLNKLGLLLQREGDVSGARSAFERISKDFSKSSEASDVAKYLALTK